jgi:hypothetical protein
MIPHESPCAVVDREERRAFAMRAQGRRVNRPPEHVPSAAYYPADSPDAMVDEHAVESVLGRL